MRQRDEKTICTVGHHRVHVGIYVFAAHSIEQRGTATTMSSYSQTETAMGSQVSTGLGWPPYRLCLMKMIVHEGAH